MLIISGNTVFYMLGTQITLNFWNGDYFLNIMCFSS